MKLLEFVLKNSFFTYEQEHYQQTFGCAMGSLVSATIANLVMEYIERAISTATHPPRWWYRYVDDSLACLKKHHVQEFHDHSVNPNVQFTKEVEKDNRLSFLDTTTTRVRGRIQVSVYRKPTHTDRYLDNNSHHPSQHKRSVVNTLLQRAQEIPSTNAGRSRERRHVIKVLRDNNYPLRFSGVASLTTILSVAIHIPTTLQALAHRQRQLLLFFRMSKASLREFHEYYETTALKWVMLWLCFARVFLEAKGQTFTLAVQRCCLQGRLR